MNPYQTPKNISNDSSTSNEVERRWIVSFVILSVIYLGGRTHAVMTGDDPNGFSFSDPVIVATFFWIMLLLKKIKDSDIKDSNGKYIGMPYTGWGYLWRTVFVFMICAMINSKILSYVPGFYKSADILKAIGFGVLFFLHSPIWLVVLFVKNKRKFFSRVREVKLHT